jgi:hypothetical protein
MKFSKLFLLTLLCGVLSLGSLWFGTYFVTVTVGDASNIGNIPNEACHKFMMGYNPVCAEIVRSDGHTVTRVYGYTNRVWNPDPDLPDEDKEVCYKKHTWWKIITLR